MRTIYLTVFGLNITLSFFLSGCFDYSGGRPGPIHTYLGSTPECLLVPPAPFADQTHGRLVGGRLEAFFSEDPGQIAVPYLAGDDPLVSNLHVRILQPDNSWFDYPIGTVDAIVGPIEMARPLVWNNGGNSQWWISYSTLSASQGLQTWLARELPGTGLFTAPVLLDRTLGSRVYFAEIGNHQTKIDFFFSASNDGASMSLFRNIQGTNGNLPATANLPDFIHTQEDVYGHPISRQRISPLKIESTGSLWSQMECNGRGYNDYLTAAPLAFFIDQTNQGKLSFASIAPLLPSAAWIGFEGNSIYTTALSSSGARFLPDSLSISHLMAQSTVNERFHFFWAEKTQGRVFVKHRQFKVDTCIYGRNPGSDGYTYNYTPPSLSNSDQLMSINSTLDGDMDVPLVSSSLVATNGDSSQYKGVAAAYQPSTGKAWIGGIIQNSDSAGFDNLTGLVPFQRANLPAGQTRDFYAGFKVFYIRGCSGPAYLTGLSDVERNGLSSIGFGMLPINQ